MTDQTLRKSVLLDAAMGAMWSKATRAKAPWAQAVWAGLMLFMTMSAGAQRSPSGWTPVAPSTDLAVTYNAERAKIASSDCGCFWLNGGSAEAAVTFYRGLGVAGSLGGGDAARIPARA